MNLGLKRETLDPEVAWLASDKTKVVKTGGITLSAAHCPLNPVTGRRIYRSGTFVGLLPPIARGLFARYYRSAGNQASLVTDPAVANAALVWTSRLLGTAGNAITITTINPGAGGVLAVAVAGTAITVTLATNGAGVITSTAADVIGAIRANLDANALVHVESERGHNGLGLVTAAGPTALAGGVASIGQQAALTTGLIGAVANTSLTYTAVDVGVAGNNIQVAYAIPAGAAVPLTSVLSGSGTVADPYVLTVSVETAGAGVGASTAREIMNHVNNLYGHLLRASIPAGNDGTGVPLVAFAAAPLVGGTEHVVSLAQGRFGILMQDVDVTDGNAIGALLYAGKVLDGRLPAPSDAFVRAALPLVGFTTENGP